jgi:hypothetical protein
VAGQQNPMDPYSRKVVERPRNSNSCSK